MSDVEISLKIPIQRLQDLLTSALEGGSSYWYCITEKHKPEIITDRCWEEDDVVFPHIDYPTNKGGWLKIRSLHGEVNGKSSWMLDLAQIYLGIQKMAEKYPQHFANFIAENDDAETGDVFLQCCLFGEIVYG